MLLVLGFVAGVVGWVSLILYLCNIARQIGDRELVRRMRLASGLTIVIAPVWLFFGVGPVARQISSVIMFDQWFSVWGGGIYRFPQRLLVVLSLLLWQASIIMPAMLTYRALRREASTVPAMRPAMNSVAPESKGTS
jgi:uncharacterized membrane protein